MAHEANQHEHNTFITLTYAPEHLPYGGSLVKEHPQKFFKRLRRRIEPHRISYYQSGEYGSTCPDHKIKNCPVCGPVQRPHYHAIIFGFDFPDKNCLGDRDGYPIYDSELLHELWPLGFHEIGCVTFESCAYVARYVMKKQTGPEAPEHYQRYIPELDTLVDIEPEYAVMSRNPAIGKTWYEEFSTDLYPLDECPIPGRGVYGKPPAYYDKLYERTNPVELDQLKAKRREKYAQSLVNGPSLESREIVKKAQLKKLERQL